jgi:hypothetical protein
VPLSAAVPPSGVGAAVPAGVGGGATGAPRTPPLGRRLLSGAAVAVVVAALAGVAWAADRRGSPPVTTVPEVVPTTVATAASAAATGKGELLDSVPHGVRIPPAEWPDACTFVTDEQVKAAVTGAESVTHVGLRHQVNTEMTPKPSDCEYSVKTGAVTRRLVVWIEALDGDPARSEAFVSVNRQRAEKPGSSTTVIDISEPLGTPAFVDGKSVSFMRGGYRLEIQYHDGPEIGSVAEALASPPGTIAKAIIDRIRA